jgi:site-specific DNA-methyltransferase (adenine-specific)
LYLGNSLEVLKTLSPKSVDCVITSPPYWMKRSYGDGNENEIGLEPDYRDYLDNVIAPFKEIKRILKPTGNLFVVIGDSFYSRSKGTGGKSDKQDSNTGSRFKAPKIPKLMPDGALMDLPSRFALKMVDEVGWIKKNNIVWWKPNAMPSSNKKKFTPDFENVYHFILDTKRYYFKTQYEPFVENTDVVYRKKLRANKKYDVKDDYKGNTPYMYKQNKERITSQESPNRMWGDSESLERQLERGRIKRTVWNIPTTNYRGSHSATYPKDLVRILMDAGCPERGTILDPFLGAGTTALIAHEQDKNWIGVEIYEQYCKDTIKRIKEEV